jgi:hypothetical protein
MLDHVFTDAIGALRDAFESALLERQAFEERFGMDMLLGDMTWQTSYGLPGEGQPPRVQVDISCEWPTWSQTAYRTWYLGESFDDEPRIDIEIVLRVQRLASPPALASLESLLSVLPALSPTIGDHGLERSAPTVEATYAGDDLTTPPEHAIEVSYEGTYPLSEAVLEDGSLLDQHFASMGGWVSALLVRVGDLKWDFLPADDPDTYEADQ